GFTSARPCVVVLAVKDQGATRAGYLTGTSAAATVVEAVVEATRATTTTAPDSAISNVKVDGFASVERRAARSTGLKLHDVAVRACDDGEIAAGTSRALEGASTDLRRDDTVRPPTDPACRLPPALRPDDPPALDQEGYIVLRVLAASRCRVDAVVKR